jgi:hypothetical protein
MNPLIVVGMHRSGTSLLSRLLSDIGIHMGGWLSRDAEAVYFQKINRKIYQSVNAHWAEPESLIQAMESPVFVQSQITRVQEELQGFGSRVGLPPSISRNFGKSTWLRLLEDPQFHWGWKDPRTALVIPIWQKVFPQARWVHIIRNGVDVAISLYQRALRQEQKQWVKLLRFDFSERTLDFDYCFDLWEVYLSSLFQALSKIEKERVIELRYENLLRNPAEELKKVLAFIDHPISDTTVQEVCSQVNQSRLDNSIAIKYHRKLIEALPPSKWIDHLGYAYKER